MQLAAGVCRAALPTLRYRARLRRELESLQPRILHTNGLKMHLLGARARPRDCSLLWHLHDYPRARPFTARLLRAHVQQCDAILANSNSVAAQARTLFGDSASVQTLHNAVDLERFRPDGDVLDLDALAGLPAAQPGSVKVGLVGSFARWKGHQVFLQALTQLSVPVPVRGYVIGEPIYETAASQYSLNELRNLAASLGLARSVGFTGRTDDVPAAMRALDIVVHASTEREPFGLVIAEAMACGRPLVVSRAGGAAEIATDGAVFHAPGNASDLASSLSGLIKDPARRAALGAAGRKAAERQFSRQRLAETLIPIYEKLAQ
jgi:glycosyltransferase involved in cell wall biosynthesis